MSESVEMQDITGGVENTPRLKHHELEVCGGPVSVYEAGGVDRPEVVLLHGAMYDEARFIWDQMFPFLSRDYHVFAVDLPRHGKSRPWQGKLERARLMEILYGTFRQLGLERFSLVGLSMGGGLSIEYAVRYPQEIRSMVLFEPGGLGEKVDHHLFVWLYLKTPGMLGILSKVYARQNRNQLEKTLRSIFVGGSKPTDPERLVSILDDEVKGKLRYKENDLDDWQVSGIGPLRLRWNLLEQIPRIQCPTLWLRGAESQLVKQHEMERAVNLAREGGAEAELVVIPKAGHILPLERPAAANEAVKAFLDRTREERGH